MSKNINESLPKEQRVRQVGVNNQGEKITIIRCSKLEGQKQVTIDVQFEDGVIVYNRNYSNFVKGRMSHPIRYEESFAHHIEVELGLNLDDIWNWEKNNELGINPYEIKKQSNKKVWLYCLENDYHNDYNGYEMTCSSFYNGSRCGYCNSKKIHWKDSLAYKYPYIAKMIAIPENDLTFDDCYNIACRSHKKYYVKCLDCGNISKNKKILDNVVRGNYGCKYCSDNISIPNKILRQISEQLNLDLEFEYSPIWLENKRLDGYDKHLKIAIEMDAEYNDNHKGKRKKVDDWKDNECLKHGIYVIRIDLMDIREYKNSTLNYIKRQILNSSLNQIYDLSNINWELTWKKSQNSLCVKTWELWNNGLHDIIEIANRLKVDRNTITKYLKRGVECSKCNYTKEESRKIGIKKYSGKNHPNSTEIICITTKKIFNTQRSAEIKYNLCRGSIYQCLNKNYNYCGKLEDGTPLVWRYLSINHNKTLRGKDISKLHNNISQEVA